MELITRKLKFNRLVLALVVALILGLAGSLGPVQAQDGGNNRQLSVGDRVTGTLDSENFAQVYSLPATAGDTISIDVSTEAADLGLVLLVIDPEGNPLVQDADLTSLGTASAADVELPTDGTYTVIVMRSTGADGDASGDFALNVTGRQQVGGQSVTLENGMTFELTWGDAIDLNLEVRDPVGGTVHAFNPGTASGGTLDADINANCDAATANEPTETIAWPSGDVPVGSYEIIVHYIEDCGILGPQDFTLTSSVNGEDPNVITGTINPGQTYLARMVLGSDASWSVENGGVNAGLNVTLFNTVINNAAPIAIGSSVTGTITNSAPAQAYSFDATANTTVDINVEAQSGSLDTYLALLAPDNTTLVFNDDTEDSTNSFIERTLAVDGTYTVLVSRYALTIGGTEGEFTLSVNMATGTTDTTATADVNGTPAPNADVLSTLPQGSIEVLLTWFTNADLSLSVRDPNGETVYDDNTQSRSGGIQAAAGNVGCTAPTTAPVSYIYWPPNRLVPGIYEIEVWYQGTCDDTTPVNFNLSVNVLDETVLNQAQQPTPDSRFMVTFEVAADGSATLHNGGFFNMSNPNTLNYQPLLDTANVIAYNSTIPGSISVQQPFVVYGFEGQAGDTISVGMEATGGTLDPAVYLLSPEGTLFDWNDDILPEGENRNSAINDKTLAFDGTYYIIATHYGLNFGGTTGTYNLTLTQ